MAHIRCLIIVVLILCSPKRPPRANVEVKLWSFRFMLDDFIGRRIDTNTRARRSELGIISGRIRTDCGQRRSVRFGGVYY